jgi:hypothetical protein
VRSLIGRLVVASLLIPPSIAAAQTTHQHHGTDQSSLFAARESSGTAWQPDETLTYGVHRAWGDWQVMFHGNLFGQFIVEPGDEIHRTGGFSTHQFESSNWGMAMMRRPLGTGKLGLRAMISLEPWTLPNCGALNLLATGEICEGDTIHDRQHPHDLFMELAAEYDRPLKNSTRWQVYAGLAGEPALGPAGFPHRLSAMDNPIAPIGHHWLDATHITFGVVTTGVYNNRWKGEVSLFNAREPDDRRADLDLAALDSVSGRVSYSPTSRLTFQVSAGHLNDAEVEFGDPPRSDVDRLTLSAMYHRPFGTGGFWATTVAVGLNSGTEIIPGGSFDATTGAFLLESSATFSDRHTWFGRVEIVDKPAHDLHAHEFATSVFTVGKLQAGYMRRLKPWKGIAAGLGGSVTAALVPEALAPRYNGRVAPGFGVFFNLRPTRQ